MAELVCLWPSRGDALVPAQGRQTGWQRFAKLISERGSMAAPRYDLPFGCEPGWINSLLQPAGLNIVHDQVTIALGRAFGVAPLP